MHQNTKVEGGTLLFPPLPKLEEKGQNELPVVEHKDDKDVAAPQRPLPAGKKAPEPTGQTVVQDAARLLIINQQPSKKVE